jgi:tetratricopeptide (TPR) repeat protein
MYPRIVVSIFALILLTAASSENDALGVARAALKQNDSASAIATTTQALNANGLSQANALALRAVRGEAEVSVKDYDAAIADLSPVISSSSAPNQICDLFGDVFLLRGEAFTGVYKYRDAIADLKLATTCEPINPEAWTKLGTGYFGLMDLPNAIQAYNEAIRLSPRFKEAFSQRGKVFEDSRLLDKALGDYSVVLSIDPNDPATLNNRATIYIMMGRLDDAIADLNRSIELDSTNYLIFVNRGTVFLAQKKYDLALADLERAKKLHADPKQEAEFEKTAGPVFSKMAELYMAQLEEALRNAPQ